MGGFKQNLKRNKDRRRLLALKNKKIINEESNCR